MADNLTDAQKAIADVALAHRFRRCWNDTDLWTQCSCGPERFYDPTKWANHAAVAVDEALGGLVRETANRAVYPDDYTPQSRFVGGWTPEETQ